MKYLIVILGAYLLGCSNMALYISKIKKVDLTAGGSGNYGASNATILMGWGAGVLTAVHDIGKAWLAVFLARWLFPQLAYGDAAAGVACVLGHIFPFYMGFKGGKGFASYSLEREPPAMQVGKKEFYLCPENKPPDDRA